jgi:hypothetical protein
MLRNALQILVTLGLLGATVCPCLAQSLLVEADAHQGHVGAQHHDGANSLPDCHGGDGESNCASVTATMGEVADFLPGSKFEPDDDADVVTLAADQPDLTHHGGSPPPTRTLVAESPVTLQDRLIE